MKLAVTVGSCQLLVSAATQTAWKFTDKHLEKKLELNTTAKNKYHTEVVTYYTTEQRTKQRIMDNQSHAMQTVAPSLALEQQSSSHDAERNTFEKANGNSLAKQALQCFVQMFFQFLGHFLP